MTRQEEVAIAVQVGRVDAKLDGFDRKLDAIHRSLKEDIGNVEVQTSATNGRVTTLEKRYVELRAFGLGIGVVLASPLLIFVLQKLL